MTIKFYKVKYEITKSALYYREIGRNISVFKYEKIGKNSDYTFIKNVDCNKKGLWNLMVGDLVNFILKLITFKETL